VVGLHENYIQQSVLSDMQKNPAIQFTSYEDIFIYEKLNFLQAVAHAAGFTENTFTGIELDVDSIQDTLSSAHTPSGISALLARKYVNYTATDCKVGYLHIAEGACRLSDGTRDENTGKLISYLVADFVKAHAGGRTSEAGQPSSVYR
jgi:formiminoglutamase